MGTGITSVLLLTLPYNGIWLYWISVSIFVLNIVLFGIGTVITVLQFTLYPKVWDVIINDPYQAMFIGCFPIGFATIIDMFALVCVPAWGERVGIVAWAFWMVDAAMAAIAAICLPFLLYVGARLPLTSVMV
jgi:tellurite resistance protein TehA-like permease